MARPVLGLGGGHKSDKIWSDALRRALHRQTKGRGSPKRLEVIANQVVELAMDGNMTAIQEIGNRMDGKATQVIGGDADRPHQLVVTIVDPTAPLVIDQVEAVEAVEAPRLKNQAD